MFGAPRGAVAHSHGRRETMLRRNARLGWIAGLVACAALASGASAIERPDAWITTKVKISLLTAQGVDGADIHVDTTDGRVTLYGDVRSEAAKAEAERLARAVDGVRDVRSILQVVPEDLEETVAASDSELQTRVEKALADDPSLEDSHIDVQSVNSGVVLLSGEAATLSDHRRALECAREVAGVRKVTSEIRSPDQMSDRELWAQDEDVAARDPNFAKDLYVTTTTKLRLMAKQDVPALDVNVDTRDGVVTLFGTVPSEAAKQAAGAEAQKVTWVRRVDNELQVVPKERQEVVAADDDRIRSSVEQRIEERPALSDAEIGVEVQNGVVRLTGQVSDSGDRLVAVTTARAVEGVRAVEDDLRIEGSRAVSSAPPRR
jgi:osmotically-inducible protein OsmY